MNAFPGMCRVNHAEVMKFKGRLTEAHELADRAGEELRLEPADRRRGVHELGEVRLRPGELAQAEGLGKPTSSAGRPSPGSHSSVSHRGTPRGVARLDPARRDDSLTLPRLHRLLPAAVEIAVAAGKTEQAAGYAERLAAIGEAYDIGDYARLLSRAARSCSRAARSTPRSTSFAALDDLGLNHSTYDVARAREQLGRALRAGGDEDAAVWELQAWLGKPSVSAPSETQSELPRCSCAKRPPR